jgi:hypothetical protein
MAIADGIVVCTRLAMDKDAGLLDYHSMFSVVAAVDHGHWGKVVPDDAALKIDILAKEPCGKSTCAANNEHPSPRWSDPRGETQFLSSAGHRS